MKMKVSRRSLELLEAWAQGDYDGVHGEPGPDGLMEIEVDPDMLEFCEGLRLGDEGLTEAVERWLTGASGLSN